MVDHEQTPDDTPVFDPSAYPEGSLIHERRVSRTPRRAQADGKGPSSAGSGTTAAPIVERRKKKERRRRIDPTTFEKQYTDEEMEFMNAMQRFKVQSGKTFPTHGDVLKIAVELGYRKKPATQG
jgi:hypothetical protein